MNYILLLIVWGIGTQASPAVTSVEFASKSACHDAAEVINDNMHHQLNSYVVCVRKK